MVKNWKTSHSTCHSPRVGSCPDPPQMKRSNSGLMVFIQIIPYIDWRNGGIIPYIIRPDMELPSKITWYNMSFLTSRCHVSSLVIRSNLLWFASSIDSAALKSQPQIPGSYRNHPIRSPKKIAAFHRLNFQDVQELPEASTFLNDTFFKGRCWVSYGIIWQLSKGRVKHG
jgi:hypothetical protein